MNYDEKGQNEPWRNGVAADLNTLLEWIASAGLRRVEVRRAEAAMRLVRRIAEFEEIR